jgi:hypothetical protein
VTELHEDLAEDPFLSKRSKPLDGSPARRRSVRGAGDERNDQFRTPHQRRPRRTHRPKTVEQCVPHEWLNNQPDISQAWSSATREMTDLLDIAEASIRNGALSNATETLTWLGCTDPKIYGAGTITSAVMPVHDVQRLHRCLIER